MAAPGHLRGSAPAFQRSDVVLPPKMTLVLALPPRHRPHVTFTLTLLFTILPAQVTPFPLFPSLLPLPSSLVFMLTASPRHVSEK